MAVREKGRGGEGYHGFSSRLPADVYLDLNEWAWENRLTFAAACSELLEKAIKAERGQPYRRRNDPADAAES